MTNNKNEDEWAAAIAQVEEQPIKRSDIYSIKTGKREKDTQ